MRKILSSRLLLVAVVLVVGVMIVGQNMGLANSQESSEAIVAASSPPQLDWALAGLVLAGALITLLRPRRRKIVQASDK